MTLADDLGHEILSLLVKLYRQYLIDTERVIMPALTIELSEISPLFSRVNTPPAPNPLAWFDELSLEGKLDQLIDDSAFMDTIRIVLGTPALWRGVWDKARLGVYGEIEIIESDEVQA